MRRSALVVRGTSFVGRNDAIVHLADLLAQSRLVTITGPGGMGKTRLVEEATPLLRERYGRALRTFTFRAAPRDSDATELSLVCGVESPEALGLSLGGGTSLVVLDNCEHVARGAADLAARLLEANEGVHIVTTSRAPLAIKGEYVLVLPPLAIEASSDDLDRSPAVALFFDRAAAAGASSTRDDTTNAAVRELCTRLDALPLAIELAAARARTVTPSEMLELMTSRLELLGGVDARPVDPHDSLSATISMSVDLLTPAQRGRFERLSVFPSSFGAELAQVVIGESAVSKIEFRGWLAELVDQSLLVADARGNRAIFCMLESVREFATAQLRASGGYDDANERLVKAMLEVAAEIVMQSSTEWRAAIIAAGIRLSDALIAAIDWCIDHDDGPGRAFMLVVPLLTSIRLGAAEAIVNAGERLLARWPNTPGPLRAEALAVLAAAAGTAGDYQRSHALANAALDDASCSPIAASLAHNRLASVALIQGDPSRALQHARTGVAEAQAAQLSPFVRTAQATEALGLVATNAIADARALATHVADDAERADDPTSAILALVVAGTAAGREGDWDAVLALATRAERVAQRAADGSWTGSNFAALHAAHRATAVAMLDGWDASLSVWNDGLDQSIERGLLHDVAVLIGFAATSAAHCGAEPAALRLTEATPTSFDLFAPSLYADEPLFPTSAANAASKSLTASVAAARAVFAGDTDAEATSFIAEEAPETAPESTAGDAFVHDGDTWSLTFDGTTACIRDLKGLASIALLLGRPNTDVHCLEIMGGSDVGDSGPAIDTEARTQYQARIRELQEDIDDARDANDLARAIAAEEELDALVEQLSAAFGLGGRDRSSGSAAQRARAAATYRIRAAVKSISRVHPELARHLDNSIRTGVWCAYRPEAPRDWAISHK